LLTKCAKTNKLSFLKAKGLYIPQKPHWRCITTTGAIKPFAGKAFMNIIRIISTFVNLPQRAASLVACGFQQF